MAGRYDRYDRRVDYPESLDAADPELRVNYRVRIPVRSHFARARLMVQVGGHQPRGAPPVRVRHEGHVFAARKRYWQQSGPVFLERLGLAHSDGLHGKK